ncbi:hypothetical protein [Paenibacillus sp. XY044]|uniref:hypothetical protein n=1 Tax=Paenibacillus sp. XY044 TaxID=2026089 RepID=UPI000B9949C3|nr:hypothetical protein [Paenibacillus sp. XY044]OZB98163.1 hypothetical protein CJP46_03060 [Paenibacillus sp. XY044]
MFIGFPLSGALWGFVIMVASIIFWNLQTFVFSLLLMIICLITTYRLYEYSQWKGMQHDKQFKGLHNSDLQFDDNDSTIKR